VAIVQVILLKTIHLKRKIKLKKYETGRISNYQDIKSIPKWVIVDIAKEDIFTENVNQRYNEVDEFVCRKCGLHLMEWVRVEIDEDDGEELHYQYELKYCPECGRRVYDETMNGGGVMKNEKKM